MRPIEVFYHLLIPSDPRAAMWTWWVDQQLGLIKESKLSDVAKIKVCITMPSDWVEMFGIFLRSNHVPGAPTYPMNFGQKVTEYINLRYPFAEIIEIRPSYETNIYEGQTLVQLHKRCQEVDIDVLYIHSKGVMNANAATANWRDVLNHYMIRQWPRCVRQLEEYDVIGLKDARSYDLLTSGNFWWSKSSHVRNLPDPLNSQIYLPEKPDVYPDAPGYRYAFERWIMTNNPKIHYSLDTQTDHYGTYYFLEDIPKEKL